VVVLGCSRLDSHIGAWSWSAAFVAYQGVSTGVLFTPMNYDSILQLIAVTWALIWLHFFISRLL
jgi:hypothetical protein